jgi:hypothetical protein
MDKDVQRVRRRRLIVRAIVWPILLLIVWAAGYHLWTELRAGRLLALVFLAVAAFHAWRSQRRPAPPELASCGQ